MKLFCKAVRPYRSNTNTKLGVKNIEGNKKTSMLWAPKTSKKLFLVGYACRVYKKNVDS